MLKLFQSIFGLSDTAQSTDNDGKLIERAIERVIDGTDPRLRAVPGYRKILHPAVVCAVDHVIGLVDALPDPMELSRHQFSRDERVQVLFASPVHLQETLLQSRTLQDFLDQRSGIDPESIYALLGVEQREKRVLGMALEGEIIRRDVAQVAISFSNHRYMGPMDNRQGSRWELEKRAFDFLIQLALKKIADLRLERTEMLRQHELLGDKLQALKTAGWGIDSLLNPMQQTSPDPRSAEQRVAQLEVELSSIDTDPVTLDRYLDVISDNLMAAPQHLQMTRVTLRLNRMGIKVEGSGDSGTICLKFRELATSDGRKVIVVPVCIPFSEIPEKLDFLAKASHYLQ